MTLKRILFLIIVLIVGSDVCLAEDKYEIRYRWYKEEIQGEYLIEDTSNNYQYSDINKYIYSDYIVDFKELDNAIDLSDSTREYELMTKYYYKKPLKINYINLGNFTGYIDIDKINIYYKNMLLNYKAVNYYGTDWNGTRGSFDMYSFISFELEKKYDPKDISVEIITKSTDSLIKYELRYTIGFNDTNDANVIRYTANSKESKYIPNNTWDILRLDDKIYEGIDKELVNELYIIYNTKVYYRYRNKLIYYYNIKKKYYDDNYYANVDGYLPDYNDYIIYSDSDEIDDNEVRVINNNAINNTDVKKTISRTTSSINDISTVNNLAINDDINKYLIVAAIIISLTIIGIGLIYISCKNCRTN